jgi:murein DD-endopeptidase MepM/ murein hydrolase activator NlpD
MGMTPSRAAARFAARRGRWRAVCVFVAPAVLGVAACRELERIPAWLFERDTPRERYEARLEYAGLLESALGRDWTAAGAAALTEAPLVSSPHAEHGFLRPSEPAAMALRVAARRGQRIVVEFDLVGDSTTAVFLDAWEVQRDSVVSFRLAASADSGFRRLELTPDRDGEFAFRAQPELLRGGRFRFEVRVLPMLAFPVQGARERDIGSRFGAPRDGGMRQHHGIDIFAKHGTPVVAAATGYVRRVGTSRLGGNIVWLRDDRGHALYYAHLDRSAVTEGARVEPGDTIGFVGNTGNAITTPPHLHFGVYRRGEGPIDPHWFVHRDARRLPRLVADTALLGAWVRVPRSDLPVRIAPDAAAEPVRRLPRHGAMRVVAAVGSWYRVRLPDGTTGYVPSGAIEPAERALGTAALARIEPVLARPAHPAAPHDVLSEARPGDSVSVLGWFGEYRLIRVGNGPAGWMREPAAGALGGAQ